MQKTLIKICGITDPIIASEAIQSGADYIGLIFHPASKRHISMEDAYSVVERVKDVGGTPVAVFVNQDARTMKNICEELMINTVQLHGDRARREHHLLPDDYQRIYVHTESQLGLAECNINRDFVLFDSIKPGSGTTFNWDNFAVMCRSLPIHFQNHLRIGIAGGLNVNNVNMAIQKCLPTTIDLIDVSTGVEDKRGSKDIHLIKQFIHAVRHAALLTNSAHMR